MGLFGIQVIQSIKEFFDRGKLVKEVNKTFLYLIPKKEGADTVYQLRPISLCNFGYKVVSKLLSNRIASIMKDLISPFQAAFIPGRWIAESTVMAHEITQKIRKKQGRGGLMATKIDMSKAYDRLEWSFIRRVWNLTVFIC